MHGFTIRIYSTRDVVKKGFRLRFLADVANERGNEQKRLSRLSDSLLFKAVITDLIEADSN